MSVLPTRAESLAAWEANQLRLNDEHAAAVAEALASAATRREQLAAAAAEARAAAAAEAQAAVVQQPQLHHHLPESQVVDPIGSALPPPFPPSTEPVQAPGAAAAAAGVPHADCIDSRLHPSTRGPPAPLAAKEVHEGSQTAWNLVSRLRQPGDCGVTHARRRAAFGPNQLAPFDNSPFKIPTVP